MIPINLSDKDQNDLADILMYIRGLSDLDFTNNDYRIIDDILEQIEINDQH